MTNASSDRPSRCHGRRLPGGTGVSAGIGFTRGIPRVGRTGGRPLFAFRTSPGLATAPVPRAVTAAELDGVFDDPIHGEPGRDRFAVHVVWEFVLLVSRAPMALQLNRPEHGVR